MVILKIVGFVVVAAVLIIVIKQEKPELAFLLSLVTGIIVLILIMKQIGIVIELIAQLAERAEIDMLYFNTILKIIGIAYIGQFGAEITRDCGENALASKIELSAKILIMLISIPIMLTLIDTILQLIPG